MRVNEIFYSLQGEGRYTGTPAVFLRLSGCNTRCPFCDTQHFSYTEMTEEAIVEAVSHYPTRHIVITGGEPTMQLAATLCQLLHREGYFIQIETNGSLALPHGCDVDWITCSPKDLELRIQRIDELKVLYPNDDMQRFEAINAKERRLQPLDTGNELTTNENVKATIDYILEHPIWNLSLQTHKILNVR